MEAQPCTHRDSGWRGDFIYRQDVRFRSIVSGRAFMILAAALMSPVSFGQAPAPDPGLTAMERRERICNSVSIEFRISETMAPGAVSKGDPMFKGPNPVPAKETVLESTNRITFEGSKVRIERNQPVFFAPTGELMPHRLEVYYNAEVGKLYYPNGAANEGKGGGIIQQGPVNEGTHDSLFVPVVLFVRGSDRVVSPYPFGQFRPSGTKLRIAGRDWLEYSYESTPGAIIRCWLAPSEDYVIRRMQVDRRGKLLEQIDMNYRADPSLGWLLDSWITNNYSSDGKLTKTTQGRVTDLRVGEKFASDYFDGRFAENSEVYDRRNGKYYRVKADGLMREISQSGEELSSSEYQPGTSWYRRNRWLLSASAAVAIVCGAVVAWRRRKRKITPVG